MKIPKSLEYIKFRMNLRKTLTKESIELLMITKEEVNREIDRRNKSKWAQLKLSYISY